MLKHNRAFSSFSVNDLDQARSFYGGTLGLEVSEGQMGLELMVDGRSIFVYSKSDHSPATFTILNFTVEHLEDAIEALGRAGTRTEVYDRPDLKTDDRGILATDGMRIAWFKDPAGNVLSLIEEG